MNKQIVICYTVICIGVIIVLSVFIYSTFIANLEFEKPMVCGSLLICELSVARLNYLEKTEDRWSCYIASLIIFIGFILSLIKAW